MEFTIEYNGFNFIVEGNLHLGESSNDYDLPDTPSTFEVENVYLEGHDGDIESILTRESIKDIHEQAEEHAINNY